MSGWWILAGVAGGHLVVSLVQTLLHRAIGHGAFGGWVRARHVGEHHSIYSGNRLETAGYSDDEKSLSVFYLVVAVPALLAGFSLLPLAVALGFAAGLGLSYLAHIYLHAQFHIRDTRYARQRWFRRLRDLHMVHHRHQGRNFAVIDLYWDKLMGTFHGSGDGGKT
ncbi:MAG: sterol desaturase family protein [Stenotrophobium sp.]